MSGLATLAREQVEAMGIEVGKVKITNARRYALAVEGKGGHPIEGLHGRRAGSVGDGNRGSAACLFVRPAADNRTGVHYG
jgi:hypothetical protein